jgi:hypothetical protein
MPFLPKNEYSFKKGHKTWNKGVPRTDEFKKKLSIDPREKLFLGKKHTTQAIEKIRISHLGRKRTEEQNKKMVATRKKNGSYVPWNKGKKCPHFSGSKSPLWRGGVTAINFKIRNSKEYRLWRKAVYERDNYTCIWCGARSSTGKKVVLNADHIKPFAFYPELRFAIDNGRTLCKECHEKTDTYKRRKIITEA